MCLIIEGTQRRRTQPVYTYKVYSVSNARRSKDVYQESFGKGELQVRSHFQGNPVILGKNLEVVSDRKSAELTNEERKERNYINKRMVERGIHSFTNRADAIKFCEDRLYRSLTFFVVKCVAHPENFVARGTFDGEEKSEVHFSLTIHSLEAIYFGDA